MNGVVETALYVQDVPRARRFYEHVLGLPVLDAADRFCALSAGGQNVLLLFEIGSTTGPVTLEGGVIPGHGGSGRLHVGFGIQAAELETWEARLEASGIAIESRVRWPRGGHSLYCRDPDGHLVELLTPGTWRVY